MKNSKKGISLIVLVITIIVIIILAAAVIITLNNNNPIASANEAKYRSDLANMQAVFTNVVGKIMTHNQAVVEITANTNIGNATENAVVADTSNVVSYKLVDASNAENATGTIVFAKGNNVPDKTDDSAPTWYTGKALPRYKAGLTVWSISTEGNLSLKVGTSDTAPVYTIN